MTKPRLTVDTITSDQLDQLYDELATLRRDNGQLLEDQAECIRLEAKVRGLEQRYAALERLASTTEDEAEKQQARAEQAEAAIARVRALPRQPQVVQHIRIHGLPDQDAYNRGWSSAISAVRAALDEPSDSARHCGGTLTHPGHKFMRLDVVFNCPGNTPKEPTT